MSADNPDLVATLAAAVERAVLAALAPVVGRVRALETATAGLGDVQTTVAALAAAGPVPGPPGALGPAGADGQGVETVTCEYDGERAVTFRWARGGAIEEKAIVLPLMLYRGVHVPGRLYERGDCVTADGSVFHCNADTTAAPGSAAGAWTLAVKRGKDAR
jgi:hypothetical protein